MPQGRVLDGKKAQVLGGAVRRVLTIRHLVHHPRMLEALAKGAGSARQQACASD